MTEVAAPTDGLRIIGKVGLGFPPARNSYQASAYNNAQPDAPTATWILVQSDSKVTAYAGKVEYGQNIRTGFAMEVAEELRVPLDTVEVVLGDTARTPWDAGTFGSQSTARVGLQLRKAAATARIALLELAASRLDLPVSELVCRDGRVSSSRNPDHGVAYGELVKGADLERDLIDDVDLTPPDEFTILGRPGQRIDAVARVTGQVVYAQDVQVPGMLYAKVRRPMTYGAKISSVDTSMVERMPGVVSVIVEDEMIAVLAESEHDADTAARMLRPRYQEQEGQASHQDMKRILKETAHDPNISEEHGSLEEGFKLADEMLEATYYIPFVSTVPMEPKAAVAAWEDDQLTLWAGGQRPFGLRADMAQHFQVEESNVRVIGMEMGGGFGTKSYYPVALEAAKLARQAGRPVRIAYTRADEMVWGNFRPAALIEIKSGFRKDGTIVAWEFNAYHAGPSANIGRRGSDGPYDIPHVKVTVSTSESPIRTGSYRSLGAAVNHFARESHMDEIAAAVGMDPVELRFKNLTHPRFRGVLEAATQRFGWTPGVAPSHRGVGAALCFDVGSYGAACFELDIAGREVNIKRAVFAADCGQVVNPVGVENQVEGAIMMGVGTALYESVEFRDGRLLTSSFARYRVPRIVNLPEIEVVIVGDQTLPSTGAGELGIVPVTAAIANAVYDLTSQRIRELPVQPHLA